MTSKTREREALRIRGDALKGLSRRDLIAGVGGALGVVLLGPRAAADISLGGRKPAVDMPVSLAVGTVRTPEFPVKRQPYLIIIRAEKRLPFADMNCMMGLTTGPGDPYNCDKEPLLQADWTLWDKGQIVHRGKANRRGGGGWANDSIDKYLGNFVGEAKKEYVLEVNFTKDGSALNVTNPHLIVMMTKPTDF
ncbi:MAG TPA: hypothetical protein VN861_09665 [Candidatus Acidoferrales bacterium]|nr:hypothetical protein [Candidatus Acidoferrales bacterium]